MAELVQDGTPDFSLGQDAWHHPDRIQKNQYARGVNVSTRGGVLGPRDRVHQVDLQFEDKILTNDLGYRRNLQNIWEGGKFQALIPYPSGSENYLITIISGLIFRTNIRTKKTVLVSEDIKCSQYAQRINWSYAAGKIVIFDFPANPIIIDGTDIKRADPNHLVNGILQPEVPISVLGTYNQNRLFVANDGVEFTAGDPVGNLLTPEAPITFTEVLTPSAPFVNQFFSLPVEEAIYSITAMGFIQSLDSSTGIGPLFVATEKKIYFYHTERPRTDWGANFGGVLLANAGISGARAFVNVNSDIVFMSGEGKIHSLSTARNEARKWGNVPISREVDNFLKFTDPTLKKFAVLGYFNNRIFISANPYRIRALNLNQQQVSDYAHGGFVILEIENLASFLSEGTPTWPGLWTGVNPMDVANIGDSFFIMSKDGDNSVGYNALYELKEDADFDIVRGKRRRTRSIVYTRLFEFGDGYAHKRMQNLTLHLRDLKGKVDVKIEYRPFHSHEWLLYTSWSHEAPYQSCGIPEDGFFNGVEAHQFKQLVFGDPQVEGCNPVTQDEYQTFTGLQLRLTIEGDEWILDNLRMIAEIIPFKENQELDLCEKLPLTKLPMQCDDDWGIPEIDAC